MLTGNYKHDYMYIGASFDRSAYSKNCLRLAKQTGKLEDLIGQQIYTDWEVVRTSNGQ
jgi:hypothetical protein